MAEDTIIDRFGIKSILATNDEEIRRTYHLLEGVILDTFNISDYLLIHDHLNNRSGNQGDQSNLIREASIYQRFSRVKFIIANLAFSEEQYQELLGIFRDEKLLGHFDKHSIRLDIFESEKYLFMVKRANGQTFLAWHRKTRRTKTDKICEDLVAQFI